MSNTFGDLFTKDVMTNIAPDKTAEGGQSVLTAAQHPMGTDLANAICEDADIDESLKESWEKLLRFEVSADMEIQGHECLLKQDDLEILPMGELHVLAAHKKQGKTSSANIIASMVLGSGFCGVKANKPDASVLIFDTEQHQDNTIRTAKYINELCGQTFGKDRLRTFNIMGQSPDEQKALFNVGVRMIKPSLVIVDVISDLLVDLSDKKEVSSVMTMIKALTRDVGCGVLAVIHFNKASDFLRDVLGTELGNKCYDFLRAEKEQTKADDVLFKIVGDTDSRGLPMKEIRYMRRKEDGLPMVFGGLTEEEQEKIDAVARVCQSIKDYITEVPGCCQGDLLKHVREMFCGNNRVNTSDNSIKSYIDTACKSYREIYTRLGKHNRTEYYIKTDNDSSAVRQSSAELSTQNR